MTPSLFAGLRLAMSGTLLGVILAELYVSTGGIGYYSRVFADSFDPPATFALVTMLAIMAVFLNEIVRRAEATGLILAATQTLIKKRRLRENLARPLRCLQSSNPNYCTNFVV